MSKKIALTILSAAISAPAMAGDEAEAKQSREERMVVTATRNPLPGRELGATVIVLDREAIETSGARNLSEILVGLPGISIRRSGSAGANTEILIRGDKSGHTMIMLDGVEQADTSSIEKNFDIGDLPLHDVERIEIVKGPHSVAYGASGLSGVINIITNKPKDGFSGSAGLEIGSYDTYGVNARVSGKSGAIGYATAVSGLTAGGFSHAGSREKDEADGYERKDASLELNYDLDKTYSAALLLKGAHAVAALDAGANVDDPNYQLTRQDLSAQLTQRVHLGEGLDTRLTAALIQNDRRYFDDPDANNPDRNQTSERSHYQGERRTLELSQLVQLAPDHTLVVSGQWVRDSAEISNKANYQGFEVDDKLAEQKVNESSYGLQYQWGFLQRVYGQWGVRTLNNSSFGKKTVGQAALNIVLVPEWTTLRLNYGRGFKTPSIYQLKAPTYGNNDLQSEYAISGEASLEQNLGGGVAASLTSFQSETVNLIEFDSVASRYYNVNRAFIKGLESKLNWTVSDHFSTQAQYTHLSTLDRQTNEPLSSRPDELWNADLIYKQDAFTATGGVRGQTRSRPRPFVDATDGYYVVDSSFAWREGPSRVTLRVNNLLNKWYQDVAGYNTPGRNYTLGGEFSF